MDENRRGGSEEREGAGAVRRSGQARKRSAGSAEGNSGQARKRPAGSAAKRDGQARKRRTGSGAERDGQARKRRTGSGAERDGQARKRPAGSAAERDGQARKRPAGSAAERDGQARKRRTGSGPERDGQARKRPAGSAEERNGQARKRPAGSVGERSRQGRKRPAGSAEERNGQGRKRPAGSVGERSGQGRKRPAGSTAERNGQARKRPAGSAAERSGQARKRRPDGTGRRERRQREELLRIAREQQLNRRLVMAACGAGVFLLIFAVILLVRRGSGQNTSGKTGTERTESIQTVSGTTDGTAAVTGTQSGPENTGEQAPAAAQAAPQLALTEDGQDYYFGNDPSYTQKITILGTGDNIIHEALYQNAATGDGGYDFTPYYRLVKPYIEEADIATVNQEAPLASRLFDVSGYPHFNSPVQAADALMDAGFDILNLANNHILDQGESGLVASLEYLSEKGYPYCGAYYDEEDRDTPHIIERNGIKVAFVGFVDWTNVDPVSEVSGQLIWNSDEAMVKRAIENAKAAADIVVVHVHWGEENEEPLTEAMTYLSQKMVDWGADLILGNHTHVVQKMRVLRRESDGKLVPVQYGGGNFLSGQKERAHLLSILTTAEFAKNPQTGDVICTGLHCRPVVTHYIGDRKDACVYPLADYTDELAAENGVKDFENEPMTTEYLWGLLHDEIPDQFLIT